MASPRSSWVSACVLAALLFAVGLATSRLGLVGHELVGHGGTATAVGGEVLAVKLFWFAGGWIRYRVPAPALWQLVAIALGGIALEAVVGGALWIALARRPSLAARVARAVGAALVIHAAWYLAAGTWHGFGDGTLLRRELVDEARYAISIGAGACGVVLAYLAARAIFGTLLATLPGTGARRIGALAAALVVAGGLLAVLAVAELRLRRDVTYGTIMQAEETRIVARELTRWEAEQAAKGRAIQEAERAARARQLADQHRELPFKYVLGGLLAIAVVAGCARSPVREPQAIARATVGRAWLLAIGSLALVIVLDAGLVL